MKEKKIFSGDYSRDMWDAVNNATTIEELQDALYYVCCRIQELETKYDEQEQNPNIVYVVVGVGEDEGDWTVLGVFTTVDKFETWLSTWDKEWQKETDEKHPETTYYETSKGCLVLTEFILNKVVLE